MYTLGTKYLIDNKGDSLRLLQADGTAATTLAETAIISFDGLVQMKVTDLINVSAARAIAGSVPNTVITVAAGTLAGTSSVTLTVEALSSRYEAGYSRTAMQYGKLFTFSATVAAGANATAIATAIQASINARIAAYGDLPFTVARTNAALTLTGVAGTEHITIKLAYDAVKASYVATGASAPGIVSATESVTVGVEAVNTGKWLEENISMQTAEAGRLGAARPGETPVAGAVYTSFYFGKSFSSEMVSAPGFVGQNTEAGSVAFGVYLNEAAAPALATDTWAIFTQVLSASTDSALYIAGAQVDEVSALLESAAFWAFD